MIRPLPFDGVQTAARARRTIVGDTGLIRAVQQVPIWPGEPRLHFATSTIASLERISGVAVPGAQGGVGFTWDEAESRAIGESIERYCATSYTFDDLLYATANALGDSAIGLDRFGLNRSDERTRAHPLPRWSADSPCHWVKGQSLTTGANRYVPACLVYVPYRPCPGRLSDLFALGTSSGQACHQDRWSAVLAGLHEIVERDAFMITWLRQVEPTRLDHLGDAYMREIYERHFQETNVRIHVFSITLDIQIPTVLGIATGGTARGPFVAVGASSRLDEREAAMKAMLECTQVATLARTLIERRPDWRPTPKYDNVRGFEDHARLYCEPDMSVIAISFSTLPRHAPWRE